MRGVGQRARSEREINVPGVVYELPTAPGDVALPSTAGASGVDGVPPEKLKLPCTCGAAASATAVSAVLGEPVINATAWLPATCQRSLTAWAMDVCA